MTPFRFLSRALAFAFLWLATSIANSEFMAGADISALPVLEAGGVTYSAGGAQGDAIELLSDSGVGWYRLRLFVNPENDSDPFVVNDLPYTIALAKRVKAAGGKLLLDFHYSDTWADPGSQSTPAAWSGLDFNQLSQRVYDYTQQAVAGMKAEGVLPEMVQIGNEISNGMLWPHGSPWTGGSNRTGFDRLATLLQAGINGAKAGAGPGDEPLVMIHHDRADRWDTTSYFFNQLVQRDVDFDVIGYSYYPKWHYDPQTGCRREPQQHGARVRQARRHRRNRLRFARPTVRTHLRIPCLQRRAASVPASVGRYGAGRPQWVGGWRVLVERRRRPRLAAACLGRRTLRLVRSERQSASRSERVRGFPANGLAG
jgi:hypothetical protein